MEISVPKARVSMILCGTRLKILFLVLRPHPVLAELGVMEHEMSQEGAEKREMKGSSTLQRSLVTI